MVYLPQDNKIGFDYSPVASCRKVRDSRDFLEDPSCVLYLPLWYPELKGSSFLSKELYLHACTVTGALWRPDGRFFDKDDHIVVSDHAALQFGTGDFTIIVWIKKTGYVDTERLISKTTGVAFPRWVLSLQRDVGSPSFAGMTDADGTAVNLLGSTATNDGWHMASVSFDRDSVTGAVLMLDTTIEDIGDPRAVGDISNVGVDVWIGDYPSGMQQYTGSVGEVWAYGRALSVVEKTHVYNATKWRYQ